MTGNTFDIEFEEITVVCAQHGEQTVRRIYACAGQPFKQPGKPSCPICSEEKERAKEAEKRAQAEAERARSHICNAKLPLRFTEFTFADYMATTAPQQRVLELCRRYTASLAAAKKPGWLVLTGLPGTGKTMLLACMVNALAQAGIATRYAAAATLGREFRATYQRNSQLSEATLFDRYTQIPVLLLDELAVASTEGTDRVLFDVLDQRYGDGRPTVIATNHPRDRLQDVLGDRLFDRLREAATFVALDWESARKPPGQRNGNSSLSRSTHVE